MNDKDFILTLHRYLDKSDAVMALLPGFYEKPQNLRRSDFQSAYDLQDDFECVKLMTVCHLIDRCVLLVGFLMGEYGCIRLTPGDMYGSMIEYLSNITDEDIKKGCKNIRSTHRAFRRMEGGDKETYPTVTTEIVRERLEEMKNYLMNN